MIIIFDTSRAWTCILAFHFLSSACITCSLHSAFPFGFALGDIRSRVRKRDFFHDVNIAHEILNIHRRTLHIRNFFIKRTISLLARNHSKLILLSGTYESSTAG
uniref:Uncharacterized protein n=1 Tax=Guillardia theta TaxID=55529 RepID=A0A6U6CL59_GUITH|mmetsp:Transcript_47396/g.148258  ORF Transcript_47396/g.148258 Transcript_47396/m.148258 type:complete len:104 (+) Transcript_47396:341-652(+)